MIVVVTPGGARVEEPEVLDALSVRLDGLQRRDVAAALGAAGDFDGEHVWLEEDYLRTAGPSDASWRSSFDDMVAFARSRGWSSADGRRIRAHLEGA